MVCEDHSEVKKGTAREPSNSIAVLHSPFAPKDTTTECEYILVHTFSYQIYIFRFLSLDTRVLDSNHGGARA